MNWLTTYLQVGTLIVLTLYATARLGGQKPSSLDADVRRALDPNRDRLLNKAFYMAVEPAMMFSFCIIAWPLVVFAWGREQWLRRAMPTAEAVSQLAFPAEEAFRVQPGDLLEVVQLDDVERCEQVDDPLNSAPKLPFGHRNHQWRRFLITAPTGCEIWKFRSRRPSELGWIEVRSGYVHFDGEDIGDFVLTAVSHER